jgi:hypothetical protein
VNGCAFVYDGGIDGDGGDDDVCDPGNVSGDVYERILVDVESENVRRRSR